MGGDCNNKGHLRLNFTELKLGRAWQYSKARKHVFEIINELSRHLINMLILARFLSNQVHWFTSDLLSVMSDTAQIYVKVVEATNIDADVGERVGKEYIR